MSVLVLFLFMGESGVSRSYSYFRLNDHVLFVQGNLTFFLKGNLEYKLGKDC